MATNRWILYLPLAAMIAVLAGCSSGSSNTQNPPPPPPSNVTIAFQPEPGGSLAVGFTESLTAVVTNDPSNSGVDWNLTCQNPPNCGSLTVNGLSASHTASGAPITYTAPSSISANSMTVEIVAFATVDQTKNQVAPITIATFNSSLPAGTYVLQAQGVDPNSNAYQFAGVIKLDGQGNVTGGEQTVNSGGVSAGANILGTSSYFLGNDGRGTITLNWIAIANPNINGTETFAFVFLNNSQQPTENPQALISEIDSSSATGTMDLQQTGTIPAPAGSYSFVMNGTDVLDTLPLAFGGVFNIQSGKTAITGVTDELIAGHVRVSDGQFLAGSELSSGPDPFGQVTFTLIGLLDAIHPKPVTVILTGYIVDPTHIKLIESDTDVASGVAPFSVTGGLALGQAPGNLNDGSINGTYVYGITGVDLYQANSIPSTWTTAGLFTADGNGNLNDGFTDTFLQLNCVQSICKTGGTTGAQIRSSFTGAYSVDSDGTGRATLNGFTFLSNPPSPSYSPELFFYLTGNASPEPAALVLAAGDMVQPNQHYPSIGTGIAYAQSSAAPSFSGPYGFSFIQQNGSETDGTAELNANPTGTPQVSGIADANQSGPSQDNGFLGTFNSPTPDAPFSGTLYADPNAANQNVFPVAPAPPMAVDYYFIDPDHGFWIETDLVSASSGQVSFGYYAARTPVCTGCP